jgi:type I restriction enzyme S subunit
MVKLHDICRPKQWKTISASNLHEEGFPVYGANGKIGFFAEYTHEFPTLMVTCRGATCGNVHISEPKSYINGNAMALDNLDAAKVDIKYLYYFLLSRGFDDVISGSAQPQITGQGLTKVEIPLPPLSEQKRIAAILDKADAIRRKRQQAIQLADDFLRAVFLDMFGDPVTNPKGFPVTRLGELCEDLFLGLTSKVDYIDGTDGYPLVRAKDINTGELSFEDVRYISEDQHKKLTKNHLTRKGDLLVSKSGTLGTCAIVRTDREFSTYESIFTVRPDSSRLELHYLIHLLQNKGFKEKLIGNKVGGTVAHLNLKMFRDFEIGVPPIGLQGVFSNTIMKCEAKLEKYRASGEESEFLFNSLSQKAFRGEL